MQTSTSLRGLAARTFANLEVTFEVDACASDCFVRRTQLACIFHAQRSIGSKHTRLCRVGSVVIYQLERHACESKPRGENVKAENDTLICG